MEPTALHEFLMKRTEVADSGCWLWTGSRDRNGYGKVGLHGRYHQVHRLAYLTLGPKFDHALTLDHLCRVRLCWRPDHLEPVTMRENVRRGEGWAGRNARVTRCPQGHEYDEQNTRWRTRGTPGHEEPERDCRACLRAAKARRRRRPQAA